MRSAVEHWQSQCEAPRVTEMRKGGEQFFALRIFKINYAPKINLYEIEKNRLFELAPP